MTLTQAEKERFKKAAEWEYQNNLRFGAQAIFAQLAELTGKKNVSINLAQIAISYTNELMEIFARVAPDAAEHIQISITEEKDIDKKGRKELIAGFRQLITLGFIELISSQNWKQHIVNLHPVWDK